MVQIRVIELKDIINRLVNRYELHPLHCIINALISILTLTYSSLAKKIKIGGIDMRFFHLFLQAFACLFLQINNLSAGIEKYKLIDLGFLKYGGSEATSINNQGQICGYFLSGTTIYIFIWEQGKKYNYTNVRTSMDPKINNAGEIYGSRWNWVDRGLWELDQETIYKWETPFAYFTWFNFEDIGYPSSLFSTGYVQYRSAFWDVNDLGQILVMNQNVINTSLTHEIWLYDNSKWIRVDNPQFHAALKINNQSQLLGYFFEEVKSPEKTKKIRTAVHDLRSGKTELLPFNETSIGFDINDAGQVVGLYYNSENKLVGYFGSPSAEIITIENLHPKAVNNHNQIVGRYLSGEKQGRPAIWDNGVLLDLAEVSTLVDDQGHQWQSLDVLIDINDRGEIIGEGLFEGKTHGFLLVPIN